MNDEENGGNEYDQEENGEDYEEEENQSDEAENNGDEKRPKLAEGFYEIEAVRKKRTRKGVVQYLIKWRGWPESANTWEPVENLMACLDVIDAFDERSGKHRSKRKRKRASGPTPQSEKKQQQQDSPDAAYPIPSVKLKIIDEPTSDPCVHNSNVANMTEHELDVEHSEIKATSSTNQENVTEFAIHIQEDQTATQVVPAEVKTEVLRASPRIGSRRRKSCAVKRYTKESNSALKKDGPENTPAASDVIVQDDIKNIGEMGSGLDSENVVDTPQSVSFITKIVKPVNYTTSILNDTEEVCVSFLVRRSDGEEVVVDNKYLKENNPILLINFYEQHLRYNSPAE